MKKTFFTTVPFLFFAMLASASTTTPIINDNNYSVGQGDVETTFKIDTEIFRGDSKGENFDMQLGGNYFITDILAPGMDFNIGHAAGAGTSVTLFPNLKAYWPLQSRILPYGQVGMGYSKIPGDNGFIFGFGFGGNYLITDSVAIGLKFSYAIIAGEGTVHRIQFPIGFAIYFKL